MKKEGEILKKKEMPWPCRVCVTRLKSGRHPCPLGHCRIIICQKKIDVRYTHCRSRNYGCLCRSSSGQQSQTEEPLNKRDFDSDVFRYIIDHVREDDVLKELRKTTAERFPRAAKMAVGPDQGAFLGWLVEALGVTKAIEVGVFTGYSSICIASSIKKNDPTGGVLLALDRDAVAMETAKEFWVQLDLSPGIIEPIVCHQAMDALYEVQHQYGNGTFDFAFIDANKRGYKEYYEMMIQLVRPGGVIVIDNVLWYGKVADPSIQNDATTQSLRELNAFIRDDPRVSMTLVPIGDGLTLCRIL